jgi:adenylate cyclase
VSTARKLAAILAADVAGYSRLVGLDEEGTTARLQALRRELIDPTIAAHHGRIVKTTGDGMLVEFASVVDAVRCAVIAFPVGIHAGDVVVDGEDLLGDGEPAKSRRSCNSRTFWPWRCNCAVPRASVS